MVLCYVSEYPNKSYFIQAERGEVSSSEEEETDDKKDSDASDSEEESSSEEEGEVSLKSKSK